MFRCWLRSGEWPRGHAGYGSAASKHSPWTYNDLLRSYVSPSSCGDSLLWTSYGMLAYGTQSAPSLPSTTDPVEAKHTMIDYMIIRYRQKVSLAPVDPRLTSHFTASAQTERLQRVTSRVVRLRRACSSDLRARPGTAGSGWASRDRQRTMYVDTSPTDCMSHPFGANLAAASSPTKMSPVHRLFAHT